ncbi:MAG: hypothetical protein J6I52_07700 [Prevotella sp.]|nr:hypothetical protein [Prevotella sp.]MBP3842550.1 hypothetical protein [Prevotella sp.]
MKKIYIVPNTEMIELMTPCTICAGSIETNGLLENGGDESEKTEGDSRGGGYWDDDY